MGGLQGIHPEHPVAQAVHVILNPEAPLPSAKLFNVQFGSSPAANNGFFDFLEGVLADLVHRSLQSEEIFLDGNIDVFQAVRLTIFVSGTGFIRDFSTSSEHTERVTRLADQLNIFLASMSLVRYHHVVLGGVIAAFCQDTHLPNLETEMWSSLRNIWAKAVRTLARAVVELRADVSVWVKA